jgi:hypothetical protein
MGTLRTHGPVKDIEEQIRIAKDEKHERERKRIYGS